MPYPYLWRIKCLFVRPKISFYVPKMPLLFSINIALLRLSFDLFCFAWLLTVRSFVFFPQIGLLISHRFLLFLFIFISFLVHPKDWSFSSTIGCYSATSCQLAVESFFFLRKSRPHLIFWCWFSGSKNLIFLRLVLFFEKSALIFGWICISPRKSSL